MGSAIDILSELRNQFPAQLVSSQAIRESHSGDESRHSRRLPLGVLFPENTLQLSEMLKVCHRFHCPITPFGVGTGLEGAAIPLEQGMSIDFSRMNQILKIHPEDFDAVIQPGLTHRSLNQAIRNSGLFFPVDPGADATLGGMASTRASGTNAVRYGTMKENVLALEVVLADGTIIRTGRRTKKSAAGYDLTRLFIGSEGTLGCISELTVRLHGIPEMIAAAVCTFDSLEGAVQSVISTLQSGIPIARIELLDDVQVDAVNRYSHLSLPVKNTLFLEFHGTEREVAAQAESVSQISADWGGADFFWRTKPEERSELWKARHDVGWACKALRPGAAFFSTDVCVPISKLAECILETKRDLANTSLLAPLVGHVGDGNFHLTILIDPESESELKEAETFNSRLVERALRLEGTCTGEHGVGLGKRKYLPQEHGEGVEVMKLIKHSFDPLNILNPGKIFLES